jgi:hypothetical protein
VPLAGLALVLAGCATIRGADPGEELIGRTLQIETARGEATQLLFRDRQRVTASFRGRSVSGRWRVRDRRLCFFWAGAPRECWPYRDPFERGRTRNVTSDRGNVVQVTLR